MAASSGVTIGHRIMHLMRDKLIHSISMAALVYLLMQLLSLLVTFFSLMVGVSFMIPSKGVLISNQQWSYSNNHALYLSTL